MTAEPIHHADSALEHVLREVMCHAGDWTEEEFLALPPMNWPRIELMDGSVLVTSAPSPDHQRVSRQLANLLQEAAGRRLRVEFGLNVRTGPGRIPIPDVVVTRETRSVPVQRAEDVVLVAEVVSPSGRRRDWFTKSEFYAEGAIPRYLLVEPHGNGEIEVTLLRLDGSSYVEEARTKAGGTLRIDEPELELDPGLLLPPW